MVRNYSELGIVFSSVIISMARLDTQLFILKTGVSGSELNLSPKWTSYYAYV